MSKQPRLDGMDGPLFVVPPKPKPYGPEEWRPVLPCPTSRCVVSERRRAGLCVHCGNRPHAPGCRLYCDTCLEKNNRWLRGE